jgi:uncharacterized NAD-dependent epimerase/dehydratase family protein
MIKKNTILLVEGGFDVLEAKTAMGVIKYSDKFNILSLIDSFNSGKTCYDVVGFGENIPIFASFNEALIEARKLNIKVDSLMLGTAPMGGVLSLSWREIIITAMKEGLDIINPLHKMFNEDEEFKKISIENNVSIWDVRKPAFNKKVANTSSYTVNANVILTVGTDCNVGKMTTALEINKSLKMRGRNSVFVATGQTGILIEGWGTAVDEVISDFCAGSAEDLVLEASKIASEKNDFIIVEGQGSLVHPGYSGMTLSLLHGCGSDALILCHNASRKKIRRYEVPIPSFNEYILIHEVITKNLKKSPVIAISLNTYGLTEEEALLEIEKVIFETGLPATDPVRFGADVIVNAVENFFIEKQVSL